MGWLIDRVFRAKLMALHEQGVPLTALRASSTSRARSWAAGGPGIRRAISPALQPRSRRPQLPDETASADPCGGF